MSSQRSVQLSLTPGRSLILMCWIAGVHAAGIAMLPLLQGVPWVLRGLLGLAVVAGAIHSLRLHALRQAPDAIVSFTFRNNGCLLVLHNGDEARAEVIGAFVNPVLVIARLQRLDDGASRKWWGAMTLILCSDAISADDHRRLRIALRR